MTGASLMFVIAMSRVSFVAGLSSSPSLTLNVISRDAPGEVLVESNSTVRSSVSYSATVFVPVIVSVSRGEVRGDAGRRRRQRERVGALGAVGDADGRALDVRVVGVADDDARVDRDRGAELDERRVVVARVDGRRVVGRRDGHVARVGRAVDAAVVDLEDHGARRAAGGVAVGAEADRPQRGLVVRLRRGTGEGQVAAARR